MGPEMLDLGFKLIDPFNDHIDLRDRIGVSDGVGQSVEQASDGGHLAAPFADNLAFKAVHDTCADYSKIQDKTGWETEIDFEEEFDGSVRSIH